jgi:outer membrane protein OmpU
MLVELAFSQNANTRNYLMKNILLASTAIVAFAGAAFADGHTGVSFAGDAEIGYNDDFDAGMFWSLGLGVSGAAELDNGLTASISGDVELNNAANSTFDGNAVTIDDLVIGLSSDTASMTFGDTAPAADKLYSSAVTNIEDDGFFDEGDLGEYAVLIGEMTFGETTVGLSYAINTSNDGILVGVDDDLSNLQVGANTTVGSVGLSLGYQEQDGTAPELLALSATTTLSGVDLGLAYASNNTADTSSMGIQAGYTFGSVTAAVFYVSNDGGRDDNTGVSINYAAGPVTVGVLYHDGNDEDLQVNATYDVGNGLTMFAGYRDEMETSTGLDGSEVFYIGGDYDLGGGANLRVSYADVTTGLGDGLTRDELGAAEDVKEGATVAVSFTF